MVAAQDFADAEKHFNLRPEFNIFLLAIGGASETGIESAWRIKSAPSALANYCILLAEPNEDSRTIEALDAGADDVVTKSRAPGAQAVLLARVRSGCRTLKTYHELIDRGNKDALTGILNRRGFIQRCERMIAANSGDGHIVVMMMDIDRFKGINDGFGHAAGDHAIAQFTACIRDVLRKDDVIGRLGGDEFAVALQGVPMHQVIAIARRLRQTVSETPLQVAPSQSIALTTSVGISVVVRGDVDVETAVKRADRAMYAAKRDGRNRVVLDRYASNALAHEA